MPNHAAHRHALQNCALFSALRPEELRKILAMASERSVGRGQTIFQRGDAESSMMAVLKGSVRISTGSADGKEVILNTIRTGEVFGEIALLDGRPRSAGATAIEDCDLLVIERRNFLPFLLRRVGATPRWVVDSAFAVWAAGIAALLAILAQLGRMVEW